AHRIVGYLEEEAVVSYTEFLEEIDAGRFENVPAPHIAREYWNLPPDARLRDLVISIRADEMKHRDVNHCLSDKIAGKECGEYLSGEDYPDRAAEVRECHERDPPP